MGASSAELFSWALPARGRGQVADGFESTKLASMDGATAATSSRYSSSLQVCRGHRTRQCPSLKRDS